MTIRPTGHGWGRLAAAFTIYPSILNPIFSLTWDSSTLPSLILPLASATLNQLGNCEDRSFVI